MTTEQWGFDHSFILRNLLMAWLRHWEFYSYPLNIRRSGFIFSHDRPRYSDQEVICQQGSLRERKALYRVRTHGKIVCVVPRCFACLCPFIDLFVLKGVRCRMIQYTLVALPIYALHYMPVYLVILEVNLVPVNENESHFLTHC
jgi:hypothetical protein